MSMFDNNTVIAGASCLEKSVSTFAYENSLTGFEFLSCIPGTIGGGIQNDTTQQNNNIEDSSQVSNDMDDEIPF